MEAKNWYVKKWIQPGIEVVHKAQVNHVENLNRLKMKVDKIVTRRVFVYNEEEKKVPRIFVEGVRCYWFDSSGEYHTASFMTSDLVPFEIAKLGVDKVNEWLERPKSDSK